MTTLAPLPYENARSGKSAVAEIQKILQGFGAEKFGVMEDFGARVVTIQFEWRKRRVTIEASAGGYAAAWLRRHPWSTRMRVSGAQHEANAIRIGQIAVYSILRDWIKGQVTAVEVGMPSFDGAFLAQIMLPSGQTVLRTIEERKLLAIGGPDA